MQFAHVRRMCSGIKETSQSNSLRNDAAMSDLVVITYPTEAKAEGDARKNTRPAKGIFN